MPTLDPATPVGQLVITCPRASRVFEELSIDYCCSGGRTLAEACAEQNLNADAVLSRITTGTAEPRTETQKDWSATSLTELCDHIQESHHSYLRRELPRLAALVHKIAAVHGEKHPELRELQAVFDRLRSELEPHMLKEEQVLFPAIRQLEHADHSPQFPFGTLANPIRVMEHEHNAAGNALGQIRKATQGFQAPEGACESWRTTLTGLKELEADLHQHIHKENNILFPRAAQLESSRVAGE